MHLQPTDGTVAKHPLAQDGCETSNSIPGLAVFEEALPGSLFECLARAIRATGKVRLKKNYTTTFWKPRTAAPRNLAEECVSALAAYVDLDDACIGMEWWLGRLPPGKKLRLHFDRDMTVLKSTGRYVHPLYASVLYLNDFPGAPTVVLQQTPSADGRTRVPEVPSARERVDAVANRYIVFPGNLRHGVIPAESLAAPAVPEDEELRLTFLVNFWDRRPLPPLCFDYDGSIYPRLGLPRR